MCVHLVPVLTCAAVPQVATHLSAAKEAEKHVMEARREHKKDPHTPHIKSADLVTNMMSLEMISNRPEESATPSGAVNKLSRRKYAGTGQQKKPSSAEPTYGVTEPELRSLLVACRPLMDGTGTDAASVSGLAEKFRLKPDDVALLVHYNAGVVSKPSSELGGQNVALRPF